MLQELFSPDKPLRYVCQDETRLGLKTIEGRLITLKGVKPTGPTQWKRDCFYLYGVVEPLSGASYFYEFSHLDACCFQHFIEQVSATFADAVVVMQMDQGSFHRSQQLEWPENLIPIFQPAHSPELNPIERLWQHLKKDLKWSSFKTLEQLQTKLDQLLAGLTPEVIASVTGYPFILDALSALNTV